MALTRVTEEGIERRRQQVARLKEEIRHLDELRQARESDLWQKRLAPAIRNSIAANQDSLDVILDSPSADIQAEYATIRGLRGGIKAYIHIIDAVEKSAAIIDGKRKQVARLVEELAEIQKEHGV